MAGSACHPILIRKYRPAARGPLRLIPRSAVVKDECGVKPCRLCRTAAVPLDRSHLSGTECTWQCALRFRCPGAPLNPIIRHNRSVGRGSPRHRFNSRLRPVLTYRCVKRAIPVSAAPVLPTAAFVAGCLRQQTSLYRQTRTRGAGYFKLLHGSKRGQVVLPQRPKGCFTQWFKEGTCPLLEPSLPPF